jgi:hypothetical protein
MCNALNTLFVLSLTNLLLAGTTGFSLPPILSNGRKVLASQSPLFMVLKDPKDKKDQKSQTGQRIAVNGSKDSFLITDVTDKKNRTEDASVKTFDEVGKLLDEINEQIIEGSNKLLKNMTDIVEEKLKESEAQSTDIAKMLADLTKDMKDAQEREIKRQVNEFEKVIIKPIEDIAFSDSILYQQKPGEDQELTNDERPKMIEDHRKELIIRGANSTLAESSRRLRTKDIIRNLNVAPFYYSLSLLLRWTRKLGAPPLALITFLKGAGSMFVSRGPKKIRSYEEFVKTGDSMQAGWKRTGEIAAKGNLAKKWAILRRSMEIWAYFSSFYIKEKRMAKMFNSGRWSEEKYSEERSKLGAEVTQNLLKLGPTFIKVRSARF